MREKQQRIAIAEACGWTEISDRGAGGINGKHPTERWMGADFVPDYLNDLNAMHDAEKQLEAEDNHAYGCYCIELYEKYGNTVSLTAAQRAEAFLKTLNLWTP
jgi:hypothetical protein